MKTGITKPGIVIGRSGQPAPKPNGFSHTDRRLMEERITNMPGEQFPREKREFCVARQRKRMMNGPNGIETNVYTSRYYPESRRMEETSPNGQMAEYVFDFEAWKSLPHLQRKLLYFYHRDIFGNPRKHSFEIEELAQRFKLDMEKINHELYDAESAVCRFRLISYDHTSWAEVLQRTRDQISGTR